MTIPLSHPNSLAKPVIDATVKVPEEGKQMGVNQPGAALPGTEAEGRWGSEDVCPGPRTHVSAKT